MVSLEDEFGDIIAKARYGLGIPTERLCLDVGISGSYLKDIEEYRVLPDKNISDKLAKELSLDSMSLWNIATGTLSPEIDYHIKDHKTHKEVNCEMKIQIVEDTRLANCYIITDLAKANSLVIDPSCNSQVILDLVKKSNSTIVGILITHSHSDHTAGLKGLVTITKAPVITEPEEKDLGLGGIQIKIWQIPGHTPDHRGFIIGNIAAVGDTIFAGSLGRAHMGPRYYKQLLSSAYRFMELSCSTLLLPGHGPLTSVSQERSNNPFLIKS